MENLVSDNPLPTGQVLENVSYGKISGQPSRILESEGFKQALAELGLTEDLITTALVQDIKGKPKRRIQELKLGAEILGMVKKELEPPKPETRNTYNFIFLPETQAKIKAMEEEIKRSFLGNVQENTETMDTDEERPGSTENTGVFDRGTDEPRAGD